MKKVNKILMATVSILLCLVLITTSVVSGVFARFVVKDTATSTVVFKKYGAAISVNLDALTKDSNKNPIPGVSVTEQNNGNSIMITVTGVQIGPGDEVPDAIKFNLAKNSATPVFDTQMKLAIDLTYDVNTFKFANSSTVKFAAISDSNDTAAKYFMPIGFTLSGGGKTYVVSEPNTSVLTASTNITDSKIENAIATGINAAITFPTNTERVSTNTVTIGNFTKNSIPKIKVDGGTATNEFTFGYKWPTDLGADKDAISNYISNHMSDTDTFTIKVTLTLEQVHISK